MTALIYCMYVLAGVGLGVVGTLITEALVKLHDAKIEEKEKKEREDKELQARLIEVLESKEKEDK